MAIHGWRTRNQNDGNLQSSPSKPESFQQQLYHGRNQNDLLRHPAARRNQNQGRKDRWNSNDTDHQSQNNARWDQNQNRNNNHWQDLSPYDRRSFILRSKDFKRHLLQALDQIFFQVDTWYPDEVITNDDMDWQPEIEVLIPQVEDVTYTYGALDSSKNRYADEKREREEVTLGFAGTWRDNIAGGDRQKLGECESHEGINWQIPRTGLGHYSTPNSLLPLTRQCYNEEEEIG